MKPTLYSGHQNILKMERETCFMSMDFFGVTEECRAMIQAPDIELHIVLGFGGKYHHSLRIICSAVLNVVPKMEGSITRTLQI